MTETQHAVSRSASAQHLVLVHDTHSRPSGSQRAVAEHRVDLERVRPPPRRRCAGRGASRSRGGRMELVPAQRVGRVDQGPGWAVFSLTAMSVPSGVSAHRPVAEARADVPIMTWTAPRPCAPGTRGAASGQREEGEAGDQRGTRPGRRAAGAAGVPASASSGSVRGDGLAQVAAGPRSRPSSLQAAAPGSASIRWMSRIAAGHGVRGRRAASTSGSPVGGREQVAGPTFEVQVVAQPVGPGHEHGRGAADRTGAAPAAAWRPDRRAVRITLRRARAPFRKSCFHVSTGKPRATLFGTLFSRTCRSVPRRDRRSAGRLAGNDAAGDT